MMRWIERIKAENRHLFTDMDDRQINLAVFKLCAARLMTQFQGTFPPGCEPETELSMLAEDAVLDALAQYDPDPDPALTDKTINSFKNMARITGHVLYLSRAAEAAAATAVQDEMIESDNNHEEEPDL